LQKYKILLNSMQNKKMLDKTQCCHLVEQIGPSRDAQHISIVYCNYLHRRKTVGRRHKVKTRRVQAMIQLPRYCHYHHNLRCQAIATTALPPLPRYCHHSIATLPPQKYLRSCHAAINDIVLTPLPPLC
jgi:hypothetical protein